MSALEIPLFPGTVTVDEFEEMDLPDSCEWELIDGTVISLTFPDIEHGDIQARLSEMLRRQLGPTAVVRVEYGYALGSHTRFRADVAAVDRERHRASVKRLDGAPELVAEVMSRSNTEAWVARIEALCLAHGATHFLRIYPRRKQLAVATAASVQWFGERDECRIEVLGSVVTLDVASLFQD